MTLINVETIKAYKETHFNVFASESFILKIDNFSNELFYNLWRIAVRIVLPLSIVIAMIAMIGHII